MAYQDVLRFAPDFPVEQTLKQMIAKGARIVSVLPIFGAVSGRLGGYVVVFEKEGDKP